ncbi:MAG: hypothetical protein AAF224_02695 [Pseudomonadota bacterium]
MEKDIEKAARTIDAAIIGALVFIIVAITASHHFGVGVLSFAIAIIAGLGAGFGAKRLKLSLGDFLPF